MKTELRLADHHLRDTECVIELWFDGVLIGAVYGAEGPGIRIISKFLRNASDAISISVLEPPVLNVTLQP